MVIMKSECEVLGKWTDAALKIMKQMHILNFTHINLIASNNLFEFFNIKINNPQNPEELLNQIEALNDELLAINPSWNFNNLDTFGKCLVTYSDAYTLAELYPNYEIWPSHFEMKVDYADWINDCIMEYTLGLTLEEEK